MAQRSEQQRMVGRLLDDLEEQIEYLKVKYDRYFNGVDRMPPTRDHDKVKKAARNLERINFTNTAAKFRAGSLRSRLISYSQHWNRILNQIENGTYKRLMAESSRREREMKKRREDAIAKREAQEGAQEGDAPRSARRPPSRPNAAKLPDGMQAKEARELFKSFVKAKKAAGERTEGLTYGALVNKLARELPKLKQKHGSDVHFEVATVGGRVRLRARRSS